MQFSSSSGIVCGCKLKHVFSPYIFNQHDLWYAGLNLTAAASLPLYHLPHTRQRKYYIKTWICIAELCEINSENICKTFNSDRKANPLEKGADSLPGSCSVAETWLYYRWIKEQKHGTVRRFGIVNFTPSREVLNTVPFTLLVSIWSGWPIHL